MIANYTTTVKAEKSIGEVMDMLASAGAAKIMIEYDAGVPAGVVFELETPVGLRAFRLPANVAGVHSVLDGMRIERRYRSVGHARNVAWRIVRDWVRAQMAIIEAEMVTVDEVFLPYMLVSQSQTLYEGFSSAGLQLTAGGQDAVCA